jgi:hypothetical protein
VSNAQNIITAFRTSITFAKADEVALFRALATAIEKHATATFVDETHGGNVCNVKFTSVTGKHEACEIADLLIVSANQRGTAFRATFWQAKKQPTSKWISAASAGTQLDFKGQFNQWDLLSRRPQVGGVGAFQPPPDLLSAFSSPSIGSFGVFFERAGVTELNYSIAEFLACASPTAKHPTLSVNGYLDRYYFGHGEAITRASLGPFLDALLAFQVGAILDPASSTHRWVASFVLGKLRQQNAQSVGARMLTGFFGPNGPEGLGDSVGPTGLSVLFVQVEEE